MGKKCIHDLTYQQRKDIRQNKIEIFSITTICLVILIMILIIFTLAIIGLYVLLKGII